LIIIIIIILHFSIQNQSQSRITHTKREITTTVLIARWFLNYPKPLANHPKSHSFHPTLAYVPSVTYHLFFLSFFLSYLLLHTSWKRPRRPREKHQHHHHHHHCSSNHFHTNFSSSILCPYYCSLTVPLFCLFN